MMHGACNVKVIIYLNSINTFISVIDLLYVCEEDTEILSYVDFTLWRIKVFFISIGLVSFTD